MRRARAAAALAAAAWIAAAARAEDDGPAAEAVRAARDEVLRRPEFRYVDRESDGSLLDALLRAWAEFLDRLQSEFPVLFTGLMVAAGVALVLLVAHLVWTWRVARRPKFQDDVRDLESALRRSDPAPFRERADRHASAGRFDEAVRELYTALLLTLDRRGAVRWARHKALLDYRIEAAGDASARAALDLFARDYPPGSFGRRPPDAAHYRALADAVDRLGAPAGAAS